MLTTKHLLRLMEDRWITLHTIPMTLGRGRFWSEELTEIDGLGIHFVHERGKGQNPLPLLITHGWPSTFY